MNIQKRGDSYRIRVSNGVDTAGKQIFVTTTYKPELYTKTGKLRSNAAIQKDVDQYAREFEKAVKEGRYNAAAKMTFYQFAIRWRDEWAVSHLTERNLADSWNTLNRRAFPAFGHIPITNLRPLDMQAFINGMQKEGLKPTTVRRQFSTVSTVFEFATRMEIIENNPCKKVELPALNKDTELHYFTVEQAKTFLRFLEKPWTSKYTSHNRTAESGTQYHVDTYTETHCLPMQYQCYFMLAIYGGFRRGELVALRWCDLDFENCIVSISRAATSLKGELKLKAPKTSAGIRSLQLPHDVFVKLNEWKRLQMELSFQLGSEWQGYKGKEYNNNFVFIQLDTGKMMHVDTPSNVFRKTLKRYNDSCTNDADKLPVIRLHDLRHTTATLLIDAGLNIEEISRRLGHSKASVTLDIYGHAMPSHDSEASAIIERLFSDNNAAENS